MENKLFRFTDIFKETLWGGHRILPFKGLKADERLIGESWELSGIPGNESVVAGGAYDGMTLTQLAEKGGSALLGEENFKRFGTRFPLLIKFIDAAQPLSVQVHPDDAYAKQYENGQNGKTEMWYVLEAEPDASLVYGFRHTMTPERLRQSLAEGTLEADLQSVPVSKNDAFLIPAGTVHAIGAGILLAEIQQSSNLTYRLYDYNRTDAQGNKRPLHIEKAVATVDYQQKPLPEQNRTVEQKDGYTEEVLCACPYFQVSRLHLQAATPAVAAAVSTTNAFAVLLCISGSGTMTAEMGETLAFQKGQCVFVPADTTVRELSGTADLLWITA